MEQIIKQLNEIYLTEEDWHTEKLTELEANRYHSYLLRHGRILLYTEGTQLLGYVESWRLTYEQLGRVICDVDFSPLEEDVLEGPIAYVANLWIDKDRRNGGTFKILKQMFLEQNKDATHFVGEKRRHGVVKVYTKLQFIKKEICDG